MPIKRIQFPDGSIKRVEVPDGATDEQILAFVQSQHQPQETKQQWDDKPDFSNVTGKVGPTVPAKRKQPDAFYNRTYDPVLRFLGGAVDGLQHHLGNIPTAIAQAGANHGEWLGNKLFGKRAPTMAEMVTGKRETFADRVNRHVSEREASYQGRTGEDALSNAGSYVGATAGEILPWMTGMGAMRAGGLLPTITATGVKGVAQKGALLAAEGGAMGAAQPVTRGSFGEEKAQQVGVGALAAPLTAAGIKLGGGAAKYVTASGRDAIANERLARMFGASPEVLAALSADSGIPGYQHTVAQRLATPEAVQAERILRNQGNTAPAFAGREAANNAALRAEAQRLAGTDADMAAAKQVRTAETAPYYDRLPGVGVDPEPVLAQLDALANSSLGVRPNIKQAVASLRAEIESRLDSGGKIDASILSGLHENVGSHLGPMASAQEKRALGPVADTIADTLDGAVPGYRDNLAAYARTSSPIRDMEAGRALVAAIDRGGSDAAGGQAVTLNHLKSLLAKDDKARYRMSPQARARAEAMLDALQRRSITNNTIAATGPGTAADALRGVSGSPIGQRMGGGILALLGGAFGGADAGLAALLANEGGIALNNNIMRRVGEKAADSRLSAQAIEAYRRSQNPALSNSPLLKLLPYETLP